MLSAAIFRKRAKFLLITEQPVEGGRAGIGNEEITPLTIGLRRARNGCPLGGRQVVRDFQNHAGRSTPLDFRAGPPCAWH